MKYTLKHCPKNPTLEYAESINIPFKYSEIVSIGGGSTIDVGKWLARKYNLKHTAIPTTAGSGSEATRFCVLMVDGKKTTFTDDKFLPEDFILEPERTFTLPRLHTISSGLDALSHAFESYWSLNATKQSQVYSILAIKLIMRFLPIVVEKPTDLLARGNMLFAANMAGKAINITKTNVCHAISYPLTEMYDLPHGIACGIVLPYFTRKFCGIKTDKLIRGLEIKKYITKKIDKELIAEIAIKSEKLKECPEVCKHDIINALC